jgi:hypothetical protein
MDSRPPEARRRPSPSTRPRGVALLLLVGLMGFTLAGCIEAGGDELMGPPEQQVGVFIRLMGEPPEGLDAVVLEFQEVSFYERSRDQWVQSKTSTKVPLAMGAKEPRLLSLVDLPMGDYTKFAARLGTAQVVINGTAGEAVALDTRCTVPVSMELVPGMDDPRLTLFMWRSDAIAEHNGEWFVEPAFTGSHVHAGEADGETVNGNPRLSRPECTPFDQEGD